MIPAILGRFSTQIGEVGLVQSVVAQNQDRVWMVSGTRLHIENEEWILDVVTRG